VHSDAAGLKGFRMAVWHGLCASAGTPKEIRKQASVV
jgi:tripartite-type tricarboxylate transporter receptor subunit TctC